MENQPGPNPRAGAGLDDDLPPHVQAVRERAKVIRGQLSAWLAANTAPEDDRAIAAALMVLAVNWHIEVMGARAGVAQLVSLMDSVVDQFRDQVW